MDLQKLLSGALASQIGSKVGADEKDVNDVLAAALPALMEGMSGNAKKKDGAESLMNALLQHADDDNEDVDKVDEEDGAKIVQHIFGDKTSKVTENLSKVAKNIDMDQVSKIMAIAAPMLMSSLGGQAKKKKNDGLDLGDLLGDVLGGGKSKKSSGFGLDDIGDAVETVQAVSGVLGKLFGK